jgi:hypothetical protein
MRLKAEKVDGIARGFFADVFALSVGEAGKSIADVDLADVGWLTLETLELLGLWLISKHSQYPAISAHLFGSKAMSVELS